MKKIITKLTLMAIVITAFFSLSAFEKKETNDLTVAVGYQFTTFDPALNTEVANSYVISHLYSAMFKKDENGELHGDLCESYEVS